MTTSNSWDKNDPKDAQVILAAMLKAAEAQKTGKPLANDWTKPSSPDDDNLGYSWR